MSPILLFVGFVILGGVWTAIWGWVLLGAGHPRPQEEVETATAVLRRRLLYAACALVLVIFAVSVRWSPYLFIRRDVLGRPAIMVRVLAQQWAWTFTPDKVPAGVPVEFAVTSGDVNHGFGLYDPQGHLVAQTQAMPGYTNRLIVTLAQPGTYTVRCLELCCTTQFLMQSQITVTRPATSRAGGVRSSWKRASN